MPWLTALMENVQGAAGAGVRGPPLSPQLTHLQSNLEDAGRVWWCTPVILALRRLRQEDGEFQATLCYTARPYLKKKVII
jgi:hypothetical protein